MELFTNRHLDSFTQPHINWSFIHRFLFFKKEVWCLTGFYLLFLLVNPNELSAQNIPSKETSPGKIFRAGAATSNITPLLGTSINGNMQDVKALHVHDETLARSLVLDNGETSLAVVVMDLCMVSREVLDKAKARAHEFTQIPVENMMISATHTHSGGTACSVFQSDPDEKYLQFLTDRAADAIIRAHHNLAPAKIGWGVGNEPTQVFNRRWKMKPGTAIINPFGQQDKVQMNPGIGNPNLLEPAGPTDPEVPVISVQSLEGIPIALLANYSLHYVGGTGKGEISADYFGMFATRMQQMIGAEHQSIPFVAMMSNGTSGNINNVNFGGEPVKPMPPYSKMEMVANTVAAEAFKVYQNIQYHEWIPLGAHQKEITRALGARAVRREGSSPFIPTIEKA